MNMEDQELGTEGEVIDKDTLPLFLSISIGAGVAFILGLFLPFVNYLIGGLVAVWHYTSSNGVSIVPWHGIRISFMATMLGGLLLTVALNITFYNENGLDLRELKENIILEFEKRGDDKSIEFAEQSFPDRLTPGLIVGMNLLMMAVLAVVVFVISLLSGWLGATRFRKGPLAL